MKRLTVILLVMIMIILPISAMALDYTVDEETGIKLYELPNGVKDEIIDGKLIKRVKEIKITADMVIIFDEGVNISRARVTKPSDSIGFGNTLTFWSTIEGFTEVDRSPLEDEAQYEFKYSAKNIGQQFRIGLPLSVNTLEKAKEYLAGRTLTYQLATPIEYNIEPIKGHHKVKLLINEFSSHIKNIVLAVSKTITEFFYDGEAITARGILFFAYVATVFCLSVLAIVFKRR